MHDQLTGGPPRLLVVVAHPDDETFGCGSLLLHAAAAGAVTSVCCATRGEAGEPTPDSGIDPGDLGVVRERELRAAARELGVSRVELLGYVDSGMAGPAGPSTLVGAPFEEVRDRVRAVLDVIRPHVVVTLDAGDGHRDHARIRDATIDAAAHAARPPDRVYLQCLPKSLMARWLRLVAAADPTSEHLQVDVPGTPDEEITTIIDTTPHMVARERSIATHGSQVSPYAALPQDLRLAFLTAERLRRVVPAWDGGPLEDDVFTHA